MKLYLLRYLRCPNCSGDIEICNTLKSELDEILAGSLVCKECNSFYTVAEGIPILLPSQFSNVAECKIRKKVSENANEMIDKWQSLYDVHHFRQLTHLRIKEQLSRIDATIEKPKVLDIGIGWGVNYLLFTSDIELWGLDISYDSLLLLKRIYERQGVSIPNLVCASLSSIPLKNIKFNLIWSTQVYQHIPDMEEIESSFSYIINELHEKEGIFVLDNLNFNCERFLLRLKNILKPNKFRKLEKEKFTDSFYIKHYSKEDFNLLMHNFGRQVKYGIVFSENLFHPDIKIIPRSRMLAQVDILIQKTSLAEFFGRQITLIIKKKRNV